MAWLVPPVLAVVLASASYPNALAAVAALGGFWFVAVHDLRRTYQDAVGRVWDKLAIAGSQTSSDFWGREGGDAGEWGVVVHSLGVRYTTAIDMLGRIGFDVQGQGDVLRRKLTDMMHTEEPRERTVRGLEIIDHGSSIANDLQEHWM